MSGNSGTLAATAAQDLLDCQALIHAFCHFIDHGQPLRVVELFTPDGVFDRRGQALTGHAELGAALARRAPTVVTRHVCSNIMLRHVSPARIVGSTYFQFFRRDDAAPAGDAPKAGPAAFLEAVGEYEDVFERTAAGWLIAHRKAVPVF
jgi:hypothetical protein